MIVLSLFDGISCGKLAFERAGIPVETYYASEVDENAIAISQKNHQDIVQLGDVTRWREWDIPWTKIGMIIGGSPCQGFSRAGKCLNFNDSRSRLFFVYVEILNHVRSVNPGVLFLLENVKMKNEWRDVITEHLGVPPIEINSKLVSGQHRLRTYWTNIPGVTQPEDRGIKLSDILEDPEVDYITAPDGMKFDTTISAQSRALVNCVDGEVRVSQTTKLGYILAEDGDGVNLAFPTSKSRRGRVIKQKSSTLDCACNICVFKDGLIRRFTIRELERLQTLPDGYTDGATKGNAQKAIGNGWTVDVIAHIFGYLNTERLQDISVKDTCSTCVANCVYAGDDDSNFADQCGGHVSDMVGVIMRCKYKDCAGRCTIHDESGAYYCVEGPCPCEELIEYAPVRRGRWMKAKAQWGDTGTPVRCSVCGRREMVGVHKGTAEERAAEMYPYCHCGAKMGVKAE